MWHGNTFGSVDRDSAEKPIILDYRPYPHCKLRSLCGGINVPYFYPRCNLFLRSCIRSWLDYRAAYKRSTCSETSSPIQGQYCRLEWGQACTIQPTEHHRSWSAELPRPFSCWFPTSNALPLFHTSTVCKNRMSFVIPKAWSLGTETVENRISFAWMNTSITSVRPGCKVATTPSTPSLDQSYNFGLWMRLWRAQWPLPELIKLRTNLKWGNWRICFKALKCLRTCFLRFTRASHELLLSLLPPDEFQTWQMLILSCFVHLICTTTKNPRTRQPSGPPWEWSRIIVSI